MKTIGITGLIGSGKTFISGLIQKIYQVELYNTDQAAKKLVYQPELRQKIEILLGEESFKDNTYQTTWVAQQIFQDNGLREKLNGLIHPAVYTDFENFLLERQQERFTLIESALMLQTGFYKKLDSLILVEAPWSIRAERVLNRDEGRTLEVIKKIDLKQKESFPNSIEIPHFKVNNDGQTLLNQLDSCYNWLLER